MTIDPRSLYKVLTTFLDKNGNVYHARKDPYQACELPKDYLHLTQFIVPYTPESKPTVYQPNVDVVVNINPTDTINLVKEQSPIPVSSIPAIPETIEPVQIEEPIILDAKKKLK